MVSQINIPEHISSKNYLQKILQNDLDTENNFKKIENNLQNSNKKINIINVKFSSGSGGGENYCSEIYRAIIEYQIQDNHNNNNNENDVKKISIIIKNMLPSDNNTKILEEMEFFEKEITMFIKIMPNIEKILNYKGMFAPKCLYSAKEPSRTLVMQDLNAMGYKLADRLEGLNEIHSKVLLSKLGQYHAASMVLAKQSPELMKQFNKGFIQEANVGTSLFDAIFIKNLQHITNIISKWPNYDTIVEKLRNLEKNFNELALKNFSSKENSIFVLNHGDLWVNNFMFKYDKNNIPYDVAFIDLQISYYGGLGVDINYFMNTSVQIDLLKSKRYELIRHYYKSLRTTLEQLNYSNIPTWEQVKNDIRSKEFFGFIAFEAILPLISMDREKSKNNNFETLSDEKSSQEKRDIMFSSKRMIETMKYSLDRFDELGVLDGKF